MSGTPTPRATTDRAQVRRREIVEAASYLFDQRGYNHVSMNDIAEAAGLRKPSLYHYVKSKEEILLAIHEHFIGILLDKLRTRAERVDDASAQVAGIVTDILTLVDSHRAFVRPFFEHYRELPEGARRRIAGQREEYAHLVEEILGRGVSSGEFRQIDVHLTSLALFGMCNWSYQWYRPGKHDPREVADCFWEIFSAGLSATPMSAAAEERPPRDRSQRR